MLNLSRDRFRPRHPRRSRALPRRAANDAAPAAACLANLIFG